MNIVQLYVFDLVFILICVFYVFYFIAHCWASFNALRALLSSRIMTNKDDDDDVL